MRSNFFKRSKIDVSRWTSQNYSKDINANEKQTHKKLSAGKYEKAIASEDWLFFQWTNHSQAAFQRGRCSPGYLLNHDSHLL